jgi:hypothetical protein
MPVLPFLMMTLVGSLTATEKKYRRAIVILLAELPPFFSVERQSAFMVTLSSFSRCGRVVHSIWTQEVHVNR